jgi:hypothetical protein
MATKEEVFAEMSKHWNDFTIAHNGTKKRNAADARKAIGELKKLVTAYRAASVEEAKASK